MLNSTGVADSDSNPVGSLPYTTGEAYSTCADGLIDSSCDRQRQSDQFGST
jgi:hypothetical protein